MNIKHIIKFGVVVNTLLLSACLSLPDQQQNMQQHFNLKAANSACKNSQSEIIKLTITNVATGLNNDRVIQLSNQTGEVVYLRNMRWPNELQTVVQQRLAADLEKAGFSVITSHYQFASSKQLLCEVRALNLISDGSQNQAHFALSCNLLSKGKQSLKNIKVNQLSHIDQLSSVSINQALSESYNLGFDQLCRKLIHKS